MSLYDHFVEDVHEFRILRDQKQVEREEKPSDSDDQVKKLSTDKALHQSYRPKNITLRQMPTVLKTKENLKMYKDLMEIIDKYLEKGNAAIRPIRCWKTRYECCFCCAHWLFGEPKQMGMVLAKNFDGEHRWITDPEHNPGVQIDAMFFTYSSEMPEDEAYDKSYKEKCTFVLCNPNAMVYQNMINYPHAYYLRFF